MNNPPPSPDEFLSAVAEIADTLYPKVAELRGDTSPVLFYMALAQITGFNFGGASMVELTKALGDAPSRAMIETQRKFLHEIIDVHFDAGSDVALNKMAPDKPLPPKVYAPELIVPKFNLRGK